MSVVLLRTGKNGMGENAGMKKQIFIVEINDAKNQRWQGKVEWVQGKRKQNFRSVLELLQLIDSAVSEEEDGVPPDAETPDGE